MDSKFEQTIGILSKGLDAMTRACDSLKDHNDLLRSDLEVEKKENIALKLKLQQAQIDQGERE